MKTRKESKGNLFNMVSDSGEFWFVLIFPPPTRPSCSYADNFKDRLKLAN